MEYSIFQDSKSIFMVLDFKIFPNNSFETAEFWFIVGLIAVLGLLQRKTPLFLKTVVFMVAQ